MSNSITVVGNLVEDPELRYTQSGTALANVRVASSRRFQDRNQEWQEETAFFRGTVWREMAEQVAESLHKGDRVIITGSIEQRDWEDNQGQKRSSLELRIQEIGPSLRWATAQVNRIARSGSGSWGGQSQTPAAPVARDDFGPDEAPF
ncbi:MAG: single-stranded DNA-binding protein [Acidimicrobiia bacterium]|jgi:single-strand DNA-binding protein|nr:MAG: single-stranded DNA-binding protein [Acidimicrobiia bacterium]